MKQYVTVENMTCAGCANAVKTNFEAIRGVSSAEVDLENKRVTLATDRELGIDELQEALAETAYRVSGLSVH